MPVPRPTPIALCRKARCALSSVLLALAFAGCATPGPLHVYTLSSASGSTIRDNRGEFAAEVPSFVRDDETVTAFAYDPFTDHFFLAIAPGNLLRVVDRPARAIKREIPLPDGQLDHANDLAIKPSTGHVFVVRSGDRHIVELTRLGKWIRDIPLADEIKHPTGIAYDAARDQLLVVHSLAPRSATVSALDLGDQAPRTFTLERGVTGPIGFDAEARELYGILSGPNLGVVGVFNEEGRLVRTVEGPARFIDVGPRSLVRVF